MACHRKLGDATESVGQSARRLAQSALFGLRTRMQRTSATPWAFAFRGMFWAASLFTLVMALITFPHTAEPGLPINDKIQHGLAFATLTTLALLGYRRVPPLRIGERLSFFGAMIEILQAMPVIHRDCDIRDWMADTLAIVAVLGARHLLTAFRSE